MFLLSLKYILIQSVNITRTVEIEEQTLQVLLGSKVRKFAYIIC